MMISLGAHYLDRVVHITNIGCAQHIPLHGPFLLIEAFRTYFNPSKVIFTDVFKAYCDSGLNMSEQFSLFGPAPTAEKKEPNIIYFDLETMRGADEVGGWSNIKKMGMAVGVCYETGSKKYHVFEEHQVGDLINLLRSADLIVGFNHIRFDYEVLRGYNSFDFNKLPSFDMLIDLNEILGHRIKLDTVAKNTLGISKSADGLQSLQWFKEGKMDLIKEYCQQDVKVTMDVFLHGVNKGFVNIDKFGDVIKVPVQWNVEKILSKFKTITNGLI